MSGEARLERLWSPWRMAYIAAASRSERRGRRAAPATGRAGRSPKREGDDCLFCRLREHRNDRADLVLVRRPHAFLMLNRFPYNPAHVMVAVSRHAARFADLTPDERGDLIDLTALAERALAAEYRPHGVNYGANAGRSAGAGFPGHLHLHLVPRWSGDTNFMPTVAETRVLPESLGRTWMRLRRAVVALDRKAGARGGRRGGG